MLQLVGHTAWTVADAPRKTIDGAAAGEAVRLAQEKFDERVSEPAFYDLSDSEQQYLKGLVDLGGESRIIDIARQLGQNEDTVKGINRRLKLSGYVSHINNMVRLTELVPERIILQEMAGYQGDADESPATRAAPAPVGAGRFSAASTRCRKWMPRKRAYCILNSNHSGGCRSQ